MRKFIIAGSIFGALLIPSVASANGVSDYKLNGYGPDTTTVGKPGCFGQWRAASAQAIQRQEGSYAGLTINGETVTNEGGVISARAQGEFQDTPSATNVTDKAICGA